MARQKGTRAEKRTGDTVGRYVNVTIPLDRAYYEKLKAIADDAIRPASSQAKAYVMKALDAVALPAT